MFALLLSPAGRYVVGALALTLALGGAYLKGRTDRARMDESAALRATVASLTHQLEQTRAVADAASARANVRSSETIELNRKVADYESALAKLPRDCGVLSSDDVRRLRDIIDPAAPLSPGRPADVR